MNSGNGSVAISYQDDFSIAQPASTSVANGEQTTTTVNTSVTSGSAGSVNLAASNLPAGESATFSPNPVTAGQSSAMTVQTTDPTTPQGTNTPTVTGTETSTTTVSHSTTETTTVNPPNKFTVSNANDAVVLPGGSTSVSANTTVTSGQPETLTCSIQGAPPNTTWTFVNAQVAAGQPCQATVTASSSATAATSTPTVIATSTVPYNGNPNGNTSSTTDNAAVVRPAVSSVGPPNPPVASNVYGFSGFSLADFSSPNWSPLKTGLRATYARIGFPWNAVGSAQYINGSWQCVGNHGGSGGSTGNYTAQDTYGRNWLTDPSIGFDSSIQSVAAQGLQPVVLVADAYNGSSSGSPATYYQENNNGDHGIPDSSLADQVRYTCGVYFMLAEADRLQIPIKFFESWNEPDISQLTPAHTDGNNIAIPGESGEGWGNSNTGYSASPFHAAILWDLADSAGIYLNYQLGLYGVTEPTVNVAAGTMSSMENGSRPAPYVANDWLHYYILGLVCPNGATSCVSQHPAYWSLHDYNDVNAYGIAWGLYGRAPASPFWNVTTFESILTSAWGSGYRPALWITEAAAWLTSAQRGYAGLGGADANGVTYTCSNTDTGETSTPIVGACLDYQPTLASQANARLVQAYAAQGFMQLTQQPWVTMVLWHHFQKGAYGNWDSALIDGNGLPRSSYCVLAYNELPTDAANPNKPAPSQNCTGDPADGWINGGFSDYN